MTDPATVVSPKDKWTLLAVLCSSPKGSAHPWSIALGQWEGESRLAIRWNGNKDHPKGNPTSRGLPTWFMVPPELEECLLQSDKIDADKLGLAKALLKH